MPDFVAKISFFKNERSGVVQAFQVNCTFDVI